MSFSSTIYNWINRQTFGAIAVAGVLSRCAAVPDIAGLTPDDVGLAAKGTKPNPDQIDDTDALQQQYDLQRALSASPIVFGNQVTPLSSGTEAFQRLGSISASLHSRYGQPRTPRLGPDAQKLVVQWGRECWRAHTRLCRRRTPARDR